ncbi:MAG: hypothetical protein JO267_11680 [Alphaproteobacteria bacterium]|nr:hypothetical protein [Alphaproteobacteria bacterium]
MRRGALIRIRSPERRASAVARLGVFAILFQALLFGWHTHPLQFAIGPRVGVVLSAPDHHGSSAPADSDDQCEICFTLHHHGAAAVEPGVFVPPGPVQRPSPDDIAAAVVGTGFRLFQPRAPPPLV